MKIQIVDTYRLFSDIETALDGEAFRMLGGSVIEAAAIPVGNTIIDTRVAHVSGVSIAVAQDGERFAAREDASWVTIDGHSADVFEALAREKAGL